VHIHGRNIFPTTRQGTPLMSCNYWIEQLMEGTPVRSALSWQTLALISPVRICYFAFFLSSSYTYFLPLIDRSRPPSIVHPNCHFCICTNSWHTTHFFASSPQPLGFITSCCISLLYVIKIPNDFFSFPLAPCSRHLLHWCRIIVTFSLTRPN
jgi:hypothetical protein